MSRIVSELIYQIKTDSAQFVKGMEEAKKKSEALSKSFTTAGKALTVGLTAPLVAAGAGMIKLAVEAGKTADRILDLEQITGLSTDTLQEFKNVAAVAGVDFEGLVGTLTRFQGRLKLIDQEGTASAEAVKRLGVSVRDANGELRSADDLFPEFIGALNQIEDITERNSIAQEVFGRSLQDLGPVLGLTADQIKRAREEARELGIVQSKDALIAANNFRIEVDKLKLSLQGQAQALGQELIPVIQSFIPLVSDTLKAVLGLVRGFSQIPVEAQKTAIIFATVAAALGPALISIGRLVTLLPQLKVGLAALTSPTGLAVIAIAGIAAATLNAVNQTRAWRKEWEELQDALAGKASLEKTNAELEKQLNLISQNSIKINEYKDTVERLKNANSRAAQSERDAAANAIRRLEAENTLARTRVGTLREVVAEFKRIEDAEKARQRATQQAAESEQTRLENELQKRLELETQKAAAAEQAKIEADEEKRRQEEAIAQAAKNNQLRLDFADEESKVQREAAARYLSILDAEEAAKKKQHSEELARIEKEKQARVQAAQFAYGQVLAIAQQLLENELEIVNQKAEADKRELDSRLEGIKTRYETDKKAIEDSTLDEDEKSEKLKALAESEKEQSKNITNELSELEKQKQVELAKIKRKQEVFNRSTALVNIATNTAGAIMKALEQLGPIAGGFAAGAIGILGAAQVAAVLSKPLPPIPSFAQGTRNFMVPPGFPNDSFPIMVQSGERVTVETPQQQAGGGGEGNVFQIGTVIADPAGLRELDRLLRKYGTIENIRRG